MRRAFAAGVAFVILMVLVALRFGVRHPPPERPAQPIVDAAPAAAPPDAALVIVDAAPPPKPRAPKHTPKPTRPPTKPPTKVEPVMPTPMTPLPVRPRCTHPANPGGCPALEPNINHPCDAEGVHCVYGPSCCPPVYVCNEGVFEAWFTHCP